MQCRPIFHQSINLWHGICSRCPIRESHSGKILGKFIFRKMFGPWEGSVRAGQITPHRLRFRSSTPRLPDIGRWGAETCLDGRCAVIVMRVTLRILGSFEAREIEAAQTGAPSSSSQHDSCIPARIQLWDRGSVAKSDPSILRKIPEEGSSPRPGTGSMIPQWCN
jgi:hypothetical protein